MPRPARRIPLSITLVAATSLFVSSACRKSSPDEVVTRKRPTDSGNATPGSPTPSSPTPASGGAPTGNGAPAASAGAAGSSDLASAAGAGNAPHCTASALAPGAFTKARLLEATASCATYHYCLFGAAAERLRDATLVHQAMGTAASASAARNAFADALDVWQRTEVFRFGPAAPQPQGQDLRDRIYSFPRDVRCKIDEQTASRFYATPTFFGSPSESFVTGRSLAALEVLLFYPGTDNGCTQYSAINTGGVWSSLSPDEVVRRRAEYAAAAAEDVLRSARLLLDAWDLTRGAFTRHFTLPGSPGSPFVDEQSALNAANYGLFYLDKEVKDYKLALPMGLSLDCPAAVCPERVESRYAGATLPGIANRHLLANLAGFKQLFVGCGASPDAVGFDDWLRAAGAAELAERMTRAIGRAEDAIAAIPRPLEQAITTDPEPVMAAYDAIKAITDPLKSEFLSVLNLQIPKDSETDND